MSLVKPNRQRFQSMVVERAELELPALPHGTRKVRFRGPTRPAIGSGHRAGISKTAPLRARFSSAVR